jgi:hypothetical protein
MKINAFWQRGKKPYATMCHYQLSTRGLAQLAHASSKRPMRRMKVFVGLELTRIKRQHPGGRTEMDGWSGGE